MRGFLTKLKKFWSWENINPLNWSTGEIKMFLVVYLAIMLPMYILVGLSPTPIANASDLPKMEIQSIGLETPVTAIELTDRQLISPDRIAGAYYASENKIFVIGHSSTVFKKLDQAHVDDIIEYDGTQYIIQNLKTLPKNEISMNEILQPEPEETLVIMTCAGEPLANQDATHRLIITAVKAL